MGFTLIELLAVIVILAIIALIATPIVLNIIEDSKKSAFVQTGNGIVDAAQYYYMKEMSDGTKPTEDKVFTFNGSTNGLEGLEFDGEIPKEGTLTVDVNGKVELVAHNNQYCITKGYDENEVTIKDYDGTCELPEEPICTLVDDADNSETITAGDKYQCKVKDNMEVGYYFYVLTTLEEGAETINLIMDQNINSDGTPAGMIGVAKNGENVYNLVAWNLSGKNGLVPVTAMEYLYNATKDWINIAPVTYPYNDTEYISFVSTNGVAIITAFTGDVVTIGSETVPLRARMPIYPTEVRLKQSAAYLFDNLDETGANAPYRYWTFSLTSDPDYFDSTWGVAFTGFFYQGSDYSDSNGGVRPVITVLKSALS